MPSASSSPDVRSTSRSAARSGRVTSTMVVRSRSPSASTAAANRVSCIFSPECGPEARGPLGGRLQEARPCARQAEEPQRVSGRRRVEEHVIERHARFVAREQLGELVERGDLHGARPGELLAQLGDLGLGPDGAVRRDHALAVVVGRLLGIDVEGGEPVDAGDRRGSIRERRPRASRPGSTRDRC